MNSQFCFSPSSSSSPSPQRSLAYNRKLSLPSFSLQNQFTNQHRRSSIILFNAHTPTTPPSVATNEPPRQFLPSIQSIANEPDFDENNVTLNPIQENRQTQQSNEEFVPLTPINIINNVNQNFSANGLPSFPHPQLADHQHQHPDHPSNHPSPQLLSHHHHANYPSTSTQNNFLAIGKTISKSKTNVRISNGLLTITRRTKFTTFMEITHHTTSNPLSSSPSMASSSSSSSPDVISAASNLVNRTSSFHVMPSMPEMSHANDAENMIRDLANSISRDLSNHHSSHPNITNNSTTTIIPANHHPKSSPAIQIQQLVNDNNATSTNLPPPQHISSSSTPLNNMLNMNLDDDDEDEDEHIFDNQTMNHPNSKRYKVVTVLEQVHRVSLL